MGSLAKQLDAILIEGPAPRANASHPTSSTTANVGREYGTKSILPVPNGLVAYPDTAPYP